VTDADLLLGRIVTGNFAGGAIELDTQAAETALQKDVAEPLGLDVETASFGLSEVVDENMAAAARAHAAEFGMDLGQRDMVAFGGAAPLHAARLGEKLGVNRIIVPAAAGVGSAVGFLLAPVAYEVVRSRRQNLSALQAEIVNTLMEDMRRESQSVVRQGTARDSLEETRHAYMRYVGQGHEISVKLPVETYGENHGAVFRKAFEAAYKQLYGRIIDGVDIEVLSWTLTTTAAAQEADEPPTKPRAERKLPEPFAWQTLFDPARDEAVNTPVYLREQLQAGDEFQGPVLITEDQTTTVVSSNYVAAIDARGHIVMTRHQESRDD
jgi:N-methylhydantoinase A